MEVLKKHNENNNNDNKKYVKIWGEHIDLPKFLMGLATSLLLLVIVLIIAPNDEQNTLIFGLFAVIIGFMINIKFIKPKRNIYISKEQEDDN